MSGFRRQFKRRQSRANYRQAVELLQTIPKPKRENGICSCGCLYVPDDGPCPTYKHGKANRCRVCDHDITCHRRRGEPPPNKWNTPNRIKPCPACATIAFICPTCKEPVPLKETIEEFHTGICPKCGAVDAVCPGKPKEKEKACFNDGPLK